MQSSWEKRNDSLYSDRFYGNYFVTAYFFNIDCLIPAIVLLYQLNVYLCKIMYRTLLCIILIFVMYIEVHAKKNTDGLKFYINERRRDGTLAYMAR